LNFAALKIILVKAHCRGCGNCHIRQLLAAHIVEISNGGSGNIQLWQSTFGDLIELRHFERAHEEYEAKTQDLCCAALYNARDNIPERVDCGCC